VRQQKHDRRDAALILKLLMEGRFPRIWTPSGPEKDLPQLLIHRDNLVRIRAQVKNELQHLAMNQGVRKNCGACVPLERVFGMPAALRSYRWPPAGKSHTPSLTDLKI
jgi:hypothetical protein